MMNDEYFYNLFIINLLSIYYKNKGTMMVESLDSFDEFKGSTIRDSSKESSLYDELLVRRFHFNVIYVAWQEENTDDQTKGCHC
jgi:hypothetical protein